MTPSRDSAEIAPGALTAEVIERAVRAQIKGVLAQQPPEVAKAITDPANQKALDAFFTAFSEFSAQRISCGPSLEGVAKLITAAQAYLDAARVAQMGTLAALLGIDPASITDEGT